MDIVSVLLLMYHSFLICINQTTRERIKQVYETRDQNPEDRSVAVNIWNFIWGTSFPYFSIIPGWWYKSKRLVTRTGSAAGASPSITFDGGIEIWEDSISMINQDDSINEDIESRDEEDLQIRSCKEESIRSESLILSEREDISRVKKIGSVIHSRYQLK